VKLGGHRGLGLLLLFRYVYVYEMSAEELEKEPQIRSIVVRFVIKCDVRVVVLELLIWTSNALDNTLAD